MNNKRSWNCRKYATPSDVVYDKSKIHRLNNIFNTPDIDIIHSSNHILAFEARDEIVIAFRGTQADIADIISDIGIAFNTNSGPRFTEAREFMKYMIQNFDGPFILCGHSLGGTIAASLLSQFPRHIKEIHTFNEGYFNLIPSFVPFGNKYWCYLIEGDFVSESAKRKRGINKEVYKPNPHISSKHTIKQFY